ncbi:ATP-binding protein [Thermosynechococcus sichuanensis E542]|uniref:ATP-binding protein n=1 Tax=Thermosynechococcus sichuanensis E542 TaxID=2016101 RepID=A0A7D6IQX0_9CYAN|nr:ATP-binding protein [Thermosynechococcus vestitus]QLL29673.1 ATP-binding protein [Thermosynechococcus vestitus E542]
MTLMYVAPQWQTLAFPSTLFLQPILEILLSDLPPQYKEEVRLGLQEALVNAARHGNQLNPEKLVSVRYTFSADQCWWVITDQGEGFSPPSHVSETADELLPAADCECGRGLFLIYAIFDEVYWNAKGTELSLCKYLTSTDHNHFS